MSKHTPPPWNYRAGYVSTYVNGDYIVLAEVESKLGSDNFGDEPLMLGPKERSANGHLIAAAPEMYELLTRVATSTNSGYGSMMSAAALADTLRDLSSQAKQLMAKIEGGGDNG